MTNISTCIPYPNPTATQLFFNTRPEPTQYWKTYLLHCGYHRNLTKLYVGSALVSTIYGRSSELGLSNLHLRSSIWFSSNWIDLLGPACRGVVEFRCFEKKWRCVGCKHTLHLGKNHFSVKIGENCCKMQIFSPPEGFFMESHIWICFYQTENYFRINPGSLQFICKFFFISNLFKLNDYF